MGCNFLIFMILNWSRDRTMITGRTPVRIPMKVPVRKPVRVRVRKPLFLNVSKIKARNYKSIEKVDVCLGDITVLVGPNGAGKSSFVDILRFISEVAKNGTLDRSIQNRGGIALLRKWSPRRGPDLSIEVELHDTESMEFGITYGFTLQSTKGGNYFVKNEFAYINSDGVIFEASIRNGVREKWPEEFGFMPRKTDNQSLNILSLIYRQYDAFRGIGFSTIFPDSLRPPQKQVHDYPLEENASNLATVLQRIKKRKPSHDVIVEVFKKIITDLEDVVVKPAGGYLPIKFKHKIGGKDVYFDALQESDGTLRVLGILTALYLRPKMRMLVFEEPEMTIHPGALGVLADVFKEEASNKTQIILTTHSPDLISKFSSDDLRSVAKINGKTEVSEVNESNQKSINEGLFSAGDLLRIEGSL